MKKTSKHLKICGLDITLSSNNIHIKDSWQVVHPWDMNTVLNTLREYVEEAGITMDTPLDHRTNGSMRREWITHNNLYYAGYKQDRTGSVDLNYPQKWYVRVLYFLGSLVVI